MSREIRRGKSAKSPKIALTINLPRYVGIVSYVCRQKRERCILMMSPHLHDSRSPLTAHRAPTPPRPAVNHHHHRPTPERATPKPDDEARSVKRQATDRTGPSPSRPTTTNHHGHQAWTTTTTGMNPVPIHVQSTAPIANCPLPSNPKSHYRLALQRARG